ncbi:MULTISPECIES: hypothetical protein [unclassified Duganella]|uniref:hypothetical protein n=1 Tax=unclassified Duganella TaxID=2636909 RepID=UPI00102908C4|nr:MULTISPECIES: hypothetical protein [unclassified Duganella]
MIVKPVIANLVVGDTLNAANWSVQGNLQPGDSLYGDRTVTIATLPSAYSGADWIRSANSSKAYTGAAQVRFTVTRNATLAVALDDRIAPAPAWLAAWTATTDTLTDDENGESRSFRIYTKPVVANTQVTLGDAGTTIYNNYLVMVK